MDNTQTEPKRRLLSPCPLNRDYSRCCRADCFSCRWSAWCQKEYSTEALKAIIARKMATDNKTESIKVR